MMSHKQRAFALRDQVMKTWSPPLSSGEESKADIAQTAVMISIAFVFGKDFLGELSENQEEAIDSGLHLMNDVCGV